MRRKRHTAWFKTWEMHTFIGHACREKADGWPTRAQKDAKRYKDTECEWGLDSTWQHRICSFNIKHRYWRTCRLNIGQTSVRGYGYSFNRQVEPKVWRILTRKIMERLLEVFWQTFVVYSIDMWMIRHVKLRKCSIHIECTFISLSSTELVNNGDVNWYR